MLPTIEFLERGHVGAPGLYQMPAEAYYEDPCPEPSLTQSIVKTLLSRSPAHAWIEHPRLNPKFERPDPTQYDVGIVAHRLMIGLGRDIIILREYENWMKSAAKEARAQAAKEGILAVLGKDFDRAERMVNAAKETIARAAVHDPALDGLFDPERGNGEVVAVTNSGGVWRRGSLDWLSNDLLTIADYKTTGMSAAPHVMSKRIIDAGYDIQSPYYISLLDELHREGVGRRRFIFVVQEDEPPFALTFIELCETAQTVGREKIETAKAIWCGCLKAGDWPAYPLHVQRPDYPAWAAAQWMLRAATDNTLVVPSPDRQAAIDIRTLSAG
ncbi:PD-(D/E)XK nuclease-like domain-containing protein [Blastochloris tepida]|uniref:Putative exodeoxyribonuclease 8 PDDEXK-like domain-containing protein n=1 Tax=Blastochloris tepida TaxID=2233851 RepID=A0A348FZE1_9HYPH|nr:PD-(D/E)XK nuclease-like domain-containing protein [Blastochloris tepida]BBF92674.1 hypothetical protein BLTE_13590 [Blastochloris tepida]